MNLLITPTPVIPATPNRRSDSVCIICLEGFVDPANSGWTHLTANGEEADHDAIHYKCLRAMFDAGIYHCPHDRTMLAKNSLPARTQTVFSKAQQMMINSVCAAFLGAGIAAAQTVALTGTLGAAQARICVAVTTASAGSVIAAEGVSGAAVAGIGAALVLKERGATLETAVVALAIVGVAVELAEKKIFNVLGVTRKDQISIGGGVCLGAFTAMLNYDVQTTLAIVCLTSGVFSGMITMMLRR